MREIDLAPLGLRLATSLREQGVRLDGFYYCPHHPQAIRSCYRMTCACRKPAPGLLLRAAAEHGVELAASWMIGAILDDVEAGRRTGYHTVLIDNGKETAWSLSAGRAATDRA